MTQGTQFLKQLAAAGLPLPRLEVRFHRVRQWRFDFAWPADKLALEVQGGVFGRGKPCPLCKRRRVGAHSSIEGMKKDHEKLNTAQLMGWRVLQCLPEELDSGVAFSYARRALRHRITGGQSHVGAEEQRERPAPTESPVT